VDNQSEDAPPDDVVPPPDDVVPPPDDAPPDDVPPPDDFVPPPPQDEIKLVKEREVDEDEKLPPYYSAFEAEINNLKEDNVGKVFWFPKDDVEIKEKKRKSRTTGESEDTENLSTTSFLSYCNEFFHQKWVNLNYNYENWRWNRTIIKNTTENNMKCFYEIDSNNREEAPNDQLSIDKNFVGLKLKESEILEKILANRLNLFTTYPMLPPPDPSNQFNEVDVMKQKLYTKLLVKCEELKFDMGEYEPFFGTLALYDLENNIKLSEIFEFTLSSPDIIEKLGYFFGTKRPYHNG